ncbi:hypothetical protein TPHA_0K01010 [Tetrapisispora phaffii CBS 4417]|uniref:Meiotically up-regulated protein Msb1/Mug8 domain-containing protein n=1 Tax=Tetrapisispora phaffii (strain ATCC 24235 / CBS 4417 / NBRC 1672 / NRRL Y-8282 / UCD 70-5) TaxID=1071381 RepID=G8BZA7_TETPH|nr:hypothetical protein TPHA_0K01010 [Tetrapisispora phaffii CBS 4417]CCE65235.1 hypothetical protein TPHA_0K01010 [Tetrapisispora phaffii CBS 4417]
MTTIIPEDPDLYFLDPYLPDSLSYNEIGDIVQILTSVIKERQIDENLLLSPYKPCDVASLNKLLKYILVNYDKVISDIDSLYAYIINQDVHILFQVLKFIWCRLPFGCVIGWENYLHFRKREKHDKFPENAFNRLLPQCLECLDQSRIVNDFFELIAIMSNKLDLQIEHIIYIFAIWAFNIRDNEPYSVTLGGIATKSIKYYVRKFNSRADGLLHLYMSYLRSKKMGQLVLLDTVSNYPPSNVFRSLTFETNVPLVSINGNGSLSPQELLEICSERLDFSNLELFEVFEDYVILKSIFHEEQSTIDETKHKMTRSSFEIFNYLTRFAPEGTSSHSLDTSDNTPNTIMVERLQMNDYFISAWVNLISIEESIDRKHYFGSTLVLKFEIDNFIKIVAFQNYLDKNPDDLSSNSSFDKTIASLSSTIIDISSSSESVTRITSDIGNEASKSPSPIANFISKINSKYNESHSYNDSLRDINGHSTFVRQLFPNSNKSAMEILKEDDVGTLKPSVHIKSSMDTHLQSAKNRRTISVPTLISSSNPSIDAKLKQPDFIEYEQIQSRTKSFNIKTQNIDNASSEAINSLLEGLTPKFQKLKLSPYSESSTDEFFSSNNSAIDTRENDEFRTSPLKNAIVVEKPKVVPTLVKKVAENRLSGSPGDSENNDSSLERLVKEERNSLKKKSNPYPDSPILKCELEPYSVNKNELSKPYPERTGMPFLEANHLLNNKSENIVDTKISQEVKSQISEVDTKFRKELWSSIITRPVYFPNFNSQRVYSPKTLPKNSVNPFRTMINRSPNKRKHKRKILSDDNSLISRPSLSPKSGETIVNNKMSTFEKNRPVKKEEFKRKFESDVRHTEKYSPQL